LKFFYYYNGAYQFLIIFSAILPLFFNNINYTSGFAVDFNVGLGTCFGPTGGSPVHNFRPKGVEAVLMDMIFDHISLSFHAFFQSNYRWKDMFKLRIS
jgi:hypothetical protein